MNRTEIENLLVKYREGRCTIDELALLEEQIFHAAGKPVFTAQEIAAVKNEIRLNLYAVTQPAIPANKGLRLWPRIVTIAATFAAIIFGIWFYTSRPVVTRNSQTLTHNKIVPGKNTATLTLANGKVILLSDTKTGVLIDASKLTYYDGTVVDESPASPLPSTATGQALADPDPSKVGMTISTPRGGTYQVTLPDGTKVWLNAASSLTYTAPLKERGGVRMVSLSGEAYFEVFKNKEQPFIVRSKNQELEVLGTHFNVSAYENDKNTLTSLLEGSVRVRTVNSESSSSYNAVSSILKPNQQSILTGNAFKIIDIDPIQPVAWKNGYFMFSSEPIESIMKKISRWYDVDIAYQGKITKEGFTGSVSKYENVSEVLNTLELTGLVYFKIEGRRITVMP